MTLTDESSPFATMNSLVCGIIAAEPGECPTCIVVMLKAATIVRKVTAKPTIRSGNASAYRERVMFIPSVRLVVFMATEAERHAPAVHDCLALREATIAPV